MSLNSISIDLNKLFKTGLSLDAFFTLLCLNYKYKDLLVKYISENAKIDRSVFDKLEKEEYIKINGSSIIFEDVILSQKALDLFKEKDEVKLDHKRFFQELKATYPSMAKFRGRVRRLHQDLDGCERKYRAIVTSEAMHNDILKCVKMNIKELQEKDGNLEFLPLLPTWINKKNYQTYLSDVQNLDVIIKEEAEYDSI